MTVRPKVIIFVLDGCRQDAILKANVPNIRRLIREGIYVKDCTTVFPSSTSTTHMSLLTGAYPESTGITGHFWWDESKRRLEDIGSSKFCQAETIFETLNRCTGQRGLCLGPRIAWHGSGGTILKRSLRDFANIITANQFIMRNQYLMTSFKFLLRL